MREAAALRRIHPDDNVAVALRDVPQGAVWEGVRALRDAPRGHKLSLRDIPQGGEVVKYGAAIGRASAPIRAGEWVHSHNLRTGLSGTLEYAYRPRPAPPLPPWEAGVFRGFLRPDGRVATRNEIWIVPASGCASSAAAAVAERAKGMVRGGVEGVYAFGHPYGCGQTGDDLENTKKALCGLIRHPNAGGVLVLALGCENNTPDGIKRMLGGYDPGRVRFLTMQEQGDEIAAALAEVEALVEYAAPFRREALPMRKLVVGLKCGGSDGLSGVTANPLAGAFTDRLAAAGGCAVLTEVPEMFGAETLLMDRCAGRAVFEQTVGMVNGFKEYFLRGGRPVYENPSPGNREGGITTLEEKSLGCIQKGGRAPVSDVVDYGGAAQKPGLTLLSGPGYDLVSATALAVAGAHLILFTTGRGTPLGSPVPVVKISSSTALYGRKPGWIDFDAGGLAAGAGMDGEAARLFELVRRVASGQRTRSEENGMREFGVFKDGVTL